MEFSATPQTNPAAAGTESVAQIPEVIAALTGGNAFLITTHTRPDGDAIGSVTGLARSLRKAGKVVDLVVRDPAPERFAFLLAEEQILTPDTLTRRYDAVLVLDSSTLSFTGYEEFLSEYKSLLIAIDHHLSNEKYGDLNLIDTGASSTCEIVHTLLRQAGLPLDPEVAEPLFLGLMTDTRFFQNENLRPATYFTGGNLVATGLNTADVLGRLNRSRKLAELRVQGLGLSQFQVHLGGKLTSLVLSQKDLESCGATIEHVWSCGMFGLITSLEQVIASVTIVQDPKGKCLCEFRSNSGFNVKDIAVSLGGGGHLAAAGCGLEAPLKKTAKEVIGKVQTALEAWLREHQ